MTDKRVMRHARAAAEEFGHEYIGTEHVLLGLCRVEDGTARRVLRACGVEPASVQQAVERLVETSPAGRARQLPFSARVQRVLEAAMAECAALGHSDIGTEHLLLGLLQVSDSTGARALDSAGVEAERVRAAVRAL